MTIGWVTIYSGFDRGVRLTLKAWEASDAMLASDWFCAVVDACVQLSRLERDL